VPPFQAFVVLESNFPVKESIDRLVILLQRCDMIVYARINRQIEAKWYGKVIRPLSDPVHSQGGTGILYGSLAPDGCGACRPARNPATFGRPPGAAPVDGRVAASGTPDDVMRAEILERVYEWPLVVTRDPAIGAPALVPLRVRLRGVSRSTLRPTD